MRVTVFGSGYVGLVVAACFAEVGHNVVCMDVDSEKIKDLQQGKIPIYEPGLEELVHSAVQSKHLKFTTDASFAVKHGEFQFIAVGTPPDQQGKADLKYVLAVAKSIADNMTDYTIIINKSTVPIETADKVKEVLNRGLAQRGVDIPFDVVSNPEFLKEGAALDDFRQPDRIILGVESAKAEQRMKALYAPFNHDDKRIIVMDLRSAELTKYAANAMLATKISFMNEMANLAEKVGADIEQVRMGIGADVRIGYFFTHPGCGYGGSCFGKDIQALIHTAQSYQSKADIIQAVELVNQAQKLRIVEKMNSHFQNNLAHKTFAIWGLAFKPETDDMRDAPSQVVINALIHAGSKVQIYDPKALLEARKIFGEHPNIIYCEHPEEALEGAHALVVLTEWRAFRSPDFEKIKKMLHESVIFDGRNIYEPAHLEEMGFTYYGIGRGKVKQVELRG